MAAPRRVIELAFTREDVAELRRLARSRTEPASRVERARMLLAYRETPSFYAVGRALGVTHQTVERCLRRAERLGVMEALDDSPRPGRERAIAEDARIASPLEPRPVFQRTENGALVSTAGQRLQVEVVSALPTYGRSRTGLRF